jgi:hypothetical protein
MNVHYKITLQYTLYAIVAGLAMALLLKIWNPYPLQVDTDVIKEAIRIQYIAGHGWQGLFLPGGGLRPIAYDYLFAIPVALFRVDAESLMWYATFVSFPLYALAVLYFAHGVTKSWDKSLMATFFTLATCGYWALEGPAIILPDLVSLIATIFFFAFYLHKDYRGWKQFVISVAILVVIDIGYYYMTLIALPLLILYQYWPVRRLSWPRLPMLILAVGILPVTFTAYFLTIGSGLPPISEFQVLTFFLSAYGPLILIFYLVGLGLNKIRQPVIMYSLIILGIIFVLNPIVAATLRSEALLRPCIGLVAASGLFALSDRIVKKVPKLNMSHVKLAYVIFGICTVGLAIPYYSWATGTVQNSLWYGVPLNTFDHNEAQAAFWLRQNATPGGFIISDLETSAIMQSMTDLYGPYNPMTFLSNITLVNQVYVAMSLMNGSDTQLKSTLSGIGNYPAFYFVISTRTALSLTGWEDHGPITAPNFNYLFTLMVISFQQSSPPNPQHTLETSLVYSNSEVNIYEAQA